MNSKIKLRILSISIILAFSLFSFTAAQEYNGILLVADTANANVFAITGTGFDANQTVNLGLYEIGGVTVIQAYTAATDGEGNFVATITVPSVPRTGFYPFIARTSTISGYTEHLLLSPTDQIPRTPGPAAKTITVSPENSNIFNVLGLGFGASKEVTLSLTRPQGPTVYSFPLEITTDSEGRFSVIVIVPTNMNGTYNLVASELGSAQDVTAEVTIPNLRGPAGPSGAVGPTGELGPTGQPGASGAPGQAGSVDPALAYASIALSVVAIAMSVFALIKRAK